MASSNPEATLYRPALLQGYRGSPVLLIVGTLAAVVVGFGISEGLPERYAEGRRDVWIDH